MIMNDIDRNLFDVDEMEIYCSCGELMDEIPEEHEEYFFVFDCPECGRRKYFNAFTKEDITEDFIIVQKEMD